MQSISGTYRIQSKAEMRAEILILQGFKFPIVFVVSSHTTSRRWYGKFYWSSSSKINWMLLCPVASSNRRITFSPKHSFHASTVWEACSQIFLVNPHIHNTDTTLEDHGEPGSQSIAVKQPKQLHRNHIYISSHMKTCAHDLLPYKEWSVEE